MALNSSLADKFTTAVFGTNRSAFSRFVQANALVLTDGTTKAEARALFDAQGLLTEPNLVGYCREALQCALGPPAKNISITIWDHLRRTYGGVGYTYEWRAFGSLHSWWSRQIAAKGEGCVYNPTSTENGQRLTEYTRSIHALTLDCDGTGTWDVLLTALNAMRVAYVVHESSGSEPAKPKWRLIVPLSTPFETRNSQHAYSWRVSYAMARVVFGAVGCLHGAGFDPATDLVNNAWFPGFRRTPMVPARTVFQGSGATLNLDHLIRILPPMTIGTRTPIRSALIPGVASLLELAFEEANLFGHKLPDGRSSVVCPWNECHSQPLDAGAEISTATVLFPPNSQGNIGAFFCAHSSCGFKAPDEVLAALPPEAVQGARLRHVSRASAVAYVNGTLQLEHPPDRMYRLPSRIP